MVPAVIQYLLAKSSDMQIKNILVVKKGTRPIRSSNLSGYTYVATKCDIKLRPRILVSWKLLLKY